MLQVYSQNFIGYTYVKFFFLQISINMMLYVGNILR